MLIFINYVCKLLPQILKFGLFELKFMIFGLKFGAKISILIKNYKYNF